jgi:hypothetical protein
MKWVIVGLMACMMIGLCSFQTQADEIRNFTARCKDKRVEAYRFSIGVDGKVSDDYWSRGEKFNSEWVFQYIGGNEIVLDNKSHSIIAKSGPCFSFAVFSQDPFGVSIWTYAINVGIKSVVAAQVQASIGIVDGTKTRAVELDCDFDFSD